VARSIRNSVAVDQPPDLVWPLVASSEGLSSWFVDATVIPGSKGIVTLRFSPDAQGAMPIVVWEPPHRIRFGAAEGAPGRAHEILVTESPPGGAVVEVIDHGVEDLAVNATSRGWADSLNRLQDQMQSPSP
jgi:uncharacterized protein YndB with AHSA1/START domain